jgi:hypothetical protein
VASDVLNLYLTSRQLNAVDVIARDLARGLVDFLAPRDGAGGQSVLDA